MKRCVFAILLSLPILAPLPAATKAEQDVMAAMEALRQGVLKHDAAALEKLLHPDLTYSHSNGNTESKDQAIKAFAKGSTETIEMTDMKTRIYGDTALVKGKMVTFSKSSNNGQPLQLSVLHVWLKTPQGWQLVARQSTRLNP